MSELSNQYNQMTPQENANFLLKENIKLKNEIIYLKEMIAKNDIDIKKKHKELQARAKKGTLTEEQIIEMNVTFHVLKENAENEIIRLKEVITEKDKVLKKSMDDNMRFVLNVIVHCFQNNELLSGNLK